MALVRERRVPSSRCGLFGLKPTYGHLSRARTSRFPQALTMRPDGARASLHLPRLRTCAKDFNPATRDRLIAAAILPASRVTKAQKFGRWYQQEVLNCLPSLTPFWRPLRRVPRR